MTISASPYAVFKAEEWSLSSYSPIGIGQSLRIKPKKSYVKKNIRTLNNGNTLKKTDSQDHVQLAFA